MIETPEDPIPAERKAELLATTMAVRDIVMRVTNLARDEARRAFPNAESQSDLEGRWMVTVALEVYFCAWSDSCSNQDAIEDMRELWDGCIQVPE